MESTQSTVRSTVLSTEPSTGQSTKQSTGLSTVQSTERSTGLSTKRSKIEAKDDKTRGNLQCIKQEVVQQSAPSTARSTGQ